MRVLDHRGRSVTSVSVWPASGRRIHALAGVLIMCALGSNFAGAAEFPNVEVLDLTAGFPLFAWEPVLR